MHQFHREITFAENYVNKATATQYISHVHVKLTEKKSVNLSHHKFQYYSIKSSYTS